MGGARAPPPPPGYATARIELQCTFLLKHVSFTPLLLYSNTTGLFLFIRQAREQNLVCAENCA